MLLTIYMHFQKNFVKKKLIDIHPYNTRPSIWIQDIALKYSLTTKSNGQLYKTLEQKLNPTNYNQKLYGIFIIEEELDERQLSIYLIGLTTQGWVLVYSKVSTIQKKNVDERHPHQKLVLLSHQEVMLGEYFFPSYH